MLSEHTQAQQSKALLDKSSRPRNLVFKGGSVKGIAYLGVRAALEACGFQLDSVERIGGTSAGAMNALAFALNLTIDESKRFILDLDFTDLLDDAHSSVPREKLLEIKDTNSSFFKATRASSVLTSALPALSGAFGLYPGEFVRDWLEAFIFHKTRIHDCTFQELHDLRMGTHPGFKDLYVVGFNLNTQLAQTFSVETTPTVIISDAIRISMSIPLLFQPYSPYYKTSSGQRVRDSSGHFWIDGGVVENYPIHLFDRGCYVPGSSGVSADESFFNPETLGFYLTDSTKHEFLNHRTSGDESVKPPARAIVGIQDYSFAVISSVYGREYNEHVRRQDNQRTIYIDHGSIGLLDFNLSNEQKQMLIRAGWDSVCEAYGCHIEIPETLLNISEPAKKEGSECVLS